MTSMANYYLVYEVAPPNEFSQAQHGAAIKQVTDRGAHSLHVPRATPRIRLAPSLPSPGGHARLSAEPAGHRDPKNSVKLLRT
jgi:hypothetical protein